MQAAAQTHAAGVGDSQDSVGSLVLEAQRARSAAAGMRPGMSPTPGMTRSLHSVSSPTTCLITRTALPPETADASPAFNAMLQDCCICSAVVGVADDLEVAFTYQDLNSVCVVRSSGQDKFLLPLH